MDLSLAYHATAPAQVDLRGTVTSQPSYFVGTHTKALHETFRVATSAGPVDVIDNVAIAPRVPVQVGDTVEVRGEMVHDSGKPAPIVHWTHHDPRHRHIDGFIRLQGRTYA